MEINKAIALMRRRRIPTVEINGLLYYTLPLQDARKMKNFTIDTLACSEGDWRAERPPPGETRYLAAYEHGFAMH